MRMNRKNRAGFSRSSSVDRRARYVEAVTKCMINREVQSALGLGKKFKKTSRKIKFIFSACLKAIICCYCFLSGNSSLIIHLDAFGTFFNCF